MNNEKIVFSIIMPVYNTPSNLLSACVNSIKSQSYANFELIIIDDGSRANCHDKCDSLAKDDQRINVIHTQNNGVSSARNIGLNNVNGNYLLFIDSDDEFLPDALETLHKYITNYNFDFCVFGWYDYLEDDCFDHIPAKKPTSISVNTFQIGIAGDDIIYGGGYPWNKLWSIDAIKKAHKGHIPLFDTTIHAYEDKLWALVASNGLEEILLIPDQLYKYNYNTESLSQDISITNIRLNRIYAGYDKILDYLKDTNYDAFISGCNFCFETTRRDVANLRKNKQTNLEQYKKSKKALHKICKRIPPRKLYVPINSKDFRCWLLLHYLPLSKS